MNDERTRNQREGRRTVGRDAPTLDSSQTAPRSDDASPRTRGDATVAPDSGTQPNLAGVALKLVGQTFGDYEIVEEIARGGMGVVYRAQQKSLHRTVALKMILAGQLASEAEIQRFHLEAAAAANLDHPGIVPIFEVGVLAGQHYFTMSYVAGESLADRIAEGPLSPAEAAEKLLKIAEAVSYAHKHGVVHRDLKPSNVIMDENDVPRVTDFGLAKQVEGGSDLTASGQILGTPSYMPPEQASGKLSQLTEMVDIYSLGAVLYAMLTGRPPFQADNQLDTLLQVIEREPIAIRLLNPKVPQDLETICLKCLRKQPAQRYETADDLCADLTRWSNREPILARPIGRIARGWRWCQRRPAVASLLATVVVLIVAGFAGILSQWQRAEVSRRNAIQNEIQATADRDWARQQEELASEQSRRADRHLIRAIAAVDVMLTRVADQELADLPHLHSVRRRLLEDALEFYRQFLQEEPHSEMIRAETANAYHRVGDINNRLQHYDESRDAYLEAVRAYEELLADDPGNWKYQTALANTYSDLGMLSMTFNELHDSLSYYEQAIAIGESMRQEGRLDHNGMDDLAEAYSRMGLHLRSISRWDEAEAALRQSMTIRQHLTEAHPESAQFHHTLAIVYHNLGALMDSRNQSAEAESLLRESVRLEQIALDANPESVDYLQHQARHYHSLGMVVGNLGNQVEEIRFYRKSIAFKRTNAESFPDVPSYQEELANSESSLAYALLRIQEYDESDELFTDAIARLERLVDRFPTVGDYQNQLGGVLHNRAMLMIHQHRFEQALPLLQKAIQFQTAALSILPDHPTVHQFLSFHYDSLASVALELNDHRLAAEAAENLTSVYPGRLDYLLKALDYLSDCHALAEMDADRQRYQQQYFDSAEEISAHIDENADAYNNFAWLLVASPHPDLHLPTLAQDMANRAVQLSPDSSTIWNTLGVAYYRGGEFDQAIDALNRSNELGTDSRVYNWLFLAMAHAQKGEASEAEQWLELATQWSAEHEPLDREIRMFLEEARGVLEPTVDCR